MRPEFHPEGLFSGSKVSSGSNAKQRSRPITQMWHSQGRCPEGTVPIRRTRKDDLLRASSLQNFGRKKRPTIPQPKSADPDFISQSGHQVLNIFIFIYATTVHATVIGSFVITASGGRAFLVLVN